ncbi:MAG: D-alanyl-D-alanine carboxypeptidase [Chlamydiales bacterium]|nr:D-alanyl-D-alanine carboxypeptidase [Chlamydiales bacterium]
MYIIQWIRIFSITLFFCFYQIALDAKIVLKLAQCTVVSESAILIDADSGEILFQKNASKPCFPASLTKIATALYALKAKKIEQNTLIEASQNAIGTITPAAKRKNNYKFPSYWIETGSTHISICKGEKLSFKDLLYAVLMGSANDASNVLAEYVGDGSIDKFMKDLNLYLKKIGCKETCFLNPHGLHHPKHQTSARDLAIMARNAMKIPLFADIVCKKSYVCKETNEKPCRSLVQRNSLLREGSDYYKYAIGIKTGYTLDAGPTLVAAAKKDGRTLIAVVLLCKKRSNANQDVIKLFNAGFAL